MLNFAGKDWRMDIENEEKYLNFQIFICSENVSNVFQNPQ